MPQDTLRSNKLTVRLNAVQLFFRTSGFFKSQKMSRQTVTTVLKPFTRCNKKNKLGPFSSCECLLSIGTGNSDSQNDIRDYRKYWYSGH